MTHPNKEHGWLHGYHKKPGPRPIPYEEVLNHFAAGKSLKEISEVVKRPTGQKYDYTSICRVITQAKESGDPRAMRK